MAVNSDIQIQNIVLPAAILCNCPTTIKVVLINVGLAEASAAGFEVCLESPAFDVEGGKIYRSRVEIGEGQHPLKPGGTLSVLLGHVVFLHGGQQTVTACADCEGVWPHANQPKRFEITNNIHTRPCLTILVNVMPVAWLQIAGLEIDLQDSRGNRNRNVMSLCSDTDYIAVATINNLGCDFARNFMAELNLTDQNGNIVDRVMQIVPAVGPQTSLLIELSGRVPRPLAGGTAFTFQLCIDTTNVVTPQCDRQRLCAVTPPLPVVSQGGPGAATGFTVLNQIFPGQPIPVTWSIQNDCSDLGEVTATVTFGGTQLYMSQPVPVPPRGFGGETRVNIPSPSAHDLARALYQIGQKQLHIEFRGTGMQGNGLHGMDATLTVGPEIIDFRWWAWFLPQTTQMWKQAYDVSGTLTNQSQAGVTMTVTSVTFRDTSGRDFQPPTGGAIPPNASRTFLWPNIVQAWEWFAELPWRIVGGYISYFSNSADITFTDPYDNPYSLQPVSGTVTVQVSDKKKNEALSAIALEGAAVVAAAGSFFTFGISAGLAAGFLAAAATAGKLATDPPIPDFKYHEPVTIIPTLVPKALDELKNDLIAIQSALELINRILAAVEALGRIHSKLLGAWIDNDPAGLRLQRDTYVETQRMMTTAASHLPDAMTETSQALRAAKLAPLTAADREKLQFWHQNGLPVSFSEQWVKLGLLEDALRNLDAVVRGPVGSSLAEAEGSSLDTILQGVAQTLELVVNNTVREAPSILAVVEGMNL